MSDNNFPNPDADGLNPYPEDTLDATLSLHGHLIKLFQQNGPLRFDHFMQQCLYHPQWGYYSTGESRVGKHGDFFTSVSVGSCFGMLLAHRIIHYFYENQLESLDIIEMGANTGQLASDILTTIQHDAPQIYSATRYTIVEPLPSMRQKQTEFLLPHQAIIRHTPSLEELSAQPIHHGIFLSNELVDAFPCRLVIQKDHQWLERYVSLSDQSHWQWQDSPISQQDPLHDAIKALPENLPDGYLTEIRTDLPAFADQCAAAMLSGLIITIDYGHTHFHYYNPLRTTGTLRTFHRHRAGENPLITPGEQDITAHVDFTTLASALRNAGYEPQYFENQARYLTHHASAWFNQLAETEQAPPSKLINQFKTLTHPAMMGQKFHVLECKKPAPPSATTLEKLDLREMTASHRC